MENGRAVGSHCSALAMVLGHMGSVIHGSVIHGGSVKVPLLPIIWHTDRIEEFAEGAFGHGTWPFRGHAGTLLCHVIFYVIGLYSHVCSRFAVSVQ